MRVPRGLVTAIVGLGLFVAAPAHATYLFDDYDGPLTMNLQSAEMTIHVPMHFNHGDPDTWDVQVIEPGSLGGGTGIVTPERVLGHLSGTGPLPTSGVDVPVSDQEVRWRWLNQDAMKLYVDTAWTSGPDARQHGLTYLDHVLVDMDLYVNAGKYHGNEEPPRLYVKPGFLNIPPDGYYEQLRGTIHDGTSPTTFASGSKMRKTISVPFVIPPRGAKKITATVDFVPKNDARNPVVMYRGAMDVPSSAKAGDTVKLKMKVQFRGTTMGAALGAKKLASYLAEHGRIFSTTFFRIGRESTRELIEIPTGSCFPSYDLDKAYPCKQTCPPFPGMPKGFVIFSAIGEVYGSYTCKKGAPLQAWPEI